MGGAFIEVIGDTKEEVNRLLKEQVSHAIKLGLTDLRAQMIEENWTFTTPAGVEKAAPWGGVVWVHS